jgi:hypothetical protein
MSAYQRRIVHSKLQSFDNITTYSIGTEPERKVVVAYQYAEGEARPAKGGKSGGRGQGGRNYSNRESGENQERSEGRSKNAYRSGNGRYSRNGNNRNSGRNYGGAQRTEETPVPQQPKIKQLYPRPVEFEGSEE